MGKSWWYAPGSAIVQKPERHSAGSLTCRSSWPHGGNYLWGIRYRKEKIDPQATGGPSRQAQLQDECDIAWRGLRFGQRLWEAALLVSGEGSCA